MGGLKLKPTPIDITDVYRGPCAGAALISTYLQIRGDFTIDIHYGFEAKRPDRMLVLYKLGTIKVVFEPDELAILGHAMIEGLPRAQELGMSLTDQNELRAFATSLIENAAEAAAISPYGLN